MFPVVTDAQRAQPFTYDRCCLSNCDRFGPSQIELDGEELERFRTVVTAEPAERLWVTRFDSLLSGRM